VAINRRFALGGDAGKPAGNSRPEQRRHLAPKAVLDEVERASLITWLMVARRAMREAKKGADRGLGPN
jgi:hypothetical protein